MGLFNKLANILFDEEEEVEEIPTISKKEEKAKKKEEKNDFKDDEIIVTKVENKKEILEDTIEIKKPEIEERDIQTKKFTFPFMDDDEDEIIDEMPKRSILKTKEDYSYASTLPKEEPAPKKHDFLSTKNKNAKSDAYTANRNNIYDPTITSDEHKPFTLSPIISPVYGILNENYTKDDIVERNSREKMDKIDFDSVRRKAYGTLEDEIEVSLTRVQDEDDREEEEEKKEMTIENLKEDGISINDLLIGDEEDEKTEELFDIEDVADITEKVEDEEEETIEVDDKDQSDEEDKSDDDLFDLIDSIYSGKDKEND